ncbi:MAG: DUF134 domain-containing protein [bacterium]|jgi:predicted DNA-binding protein (UPF0251 family)
MARPTKWRRVEFIPGVRHFIPTGIPRSGMEENILKVEELEALRLKDLEALEQEECAGKMNVSRQTFQRVLNAAREKVADSLVNGKAIRIEGGNFTRNICPVHCQNCGKTWEESYENFAAILEGKYSCPDCGAKDIVCAYGRGRRFCGGNCWRHGSRRD